jgi:hypothetical protein
VRDKYWTHINEITYNSLWILFAKFAVIEPAMECEKLAAADISPVAGAPVLITAASAVKDGKPILTTGKLPIPRQTEPHH